MAFNIYKWRRDQLLLEEVMNESKITVKSLKFSDLNDKTTFKTF